MEKYKTTKIWNKVAISYHKVSNISRDHIEKYEQIVDLIFKLKCRKILDLGCGSGILEKKIIEKNFRGEIIAFDNSREMLKIAKKLLENVKSVNFKLFDLDNTLPFKKDSFDCIIAVNVMYLLENPEQFLLETKRVLKNQGYFILVNPKEEGNIINFFKEYFDCSFLSSIEKISSIFFNLNHLIRIIVTQKKIDNLAKKGIIKYQSFKENQELLKLTNFRIQLVRNIQADSNWLFLLKNQK